jgi:hypothetical protein
VLYEAQQQRARRFGPGVGGLSAEQQRELQAFFLLRTVREGGTVLARLLARPPRSWQRAHFRDAAVVE